MKTSDKSKTLLVIVLGLLVLYFLFHLKALLYISASVGIIALLIPAAGDLIVKLWLKIAEVTGWVTSRLLLSVVFFVFLFPISLLFRIFTRNPLQIKNDADTMFVARNHRYTKTDLENVW